MGIIGYLVALVLILASGYLTLTLLVHKASNEKLFYRAEFCIYSFMLGAVILMFWFFLAGWLGIPLNLPTFVLIPVLYIGVMLALNYHIKPKVPFLTESWKSLFMGLPARMRGLLILGTIWVLTKVVLGGISIYNVPTYQDDTYLNWNYRAQVWYYRESLVLDAEDPDYLGRGFEQYPMTPSLMKTYLASTYGSRDDGIVNSVSFIYFVLALALMFFAVMKETKSIARAGLATYALASLPLYVVHGTNPYMDVMMGLYFFAALYMAYLMMDKKVGLTLPIVFIGLLGYVKSEGLIIFTLSVFGAIALMQAKKFFTFDAAVWKRLLHIVLGVFLINVPFILFKLVKGLGFGNGDESIGASLAEFTLHTEIFHPLYMALFQEGNYNFLFFFFVIVVVLSLWRLKKSVKDIFLLGGFLAFAFMILIYLTTFTYEYVLSQTGVNRSMIQLLFVMVFVLVISTYRLFHERKV